MKRPPKDPTDYSAHIFRENGTIKVWCVECERWSPIVVVASATATYKQNRWHARTEDAKDPVFYCGSRGCWADVGYLLDEAHKEAILRLADVPHRYQRKSPAAQLPRKMEPRQLRMKI